LFDADDHLVARGSLPPVRESLRQRTGELARTAQREGLAVHACAI
jgi:hypothetical protein